MLADLAEDAVAMSAVEAYWEEQRNALNGSLASSSDLPHEVSVSVTKMTRLLEETDAWLSQSATLAPGSPRVATTVSYSSSQLSTGDDPEPELPQHSPSIHRRRLLSMRTSSVEQFFIHDTPTRTTSTTVTHGAMTPTDVDVVLAPSPATSIVASDARVFSSPLSRSSSSLTDAGGEGRGHLERGLSSHDESWLDLVKANVAASDNEPHKEDAMAHLSEERCVVESAASSDINATLQRQLQAVVEKLAAVDEIRVQAEQTVQQLQAMKSTGEFGMQSLAALSLACVAFHAQQQQKTQDAIVERVSTNVQNQMQQYLQSDRGPAPDRPALQSPPAIALVPASDAIAANGDDEETTPPVTTPNSPVSTGAEVSLPPLSPVVEQLAEKSAVDTSAVESEEESPDPTPGVLRNWDEVPVEPVCEEQNSEDVVEVSSFSTVLAETTQHETNTKASDLPQKYSFASVASPLPAGVRLPVRGAMLHAVGFPQKVAEPAMTWTNILSATMALSVGVVFLARSSNS